ncbi:MAG: sigma-70 family RNA polymerase sigma factor, partial [Firmicutes bacterium]|nr:sigma-70 family RNA polymerase sigma factor [Bacillota bacterium]
SADKELYVIDTLKSDNRYSPDDELLLLRETVKKLDLDERMIINLRYFYDKTQSETAKQMGISQVQVSRLEKKILGKIKEKIL